MPKVEDKTMILSLRKIGNSQGVVLPKAMLEGLDFSHGIRVVKTGQELRMQPVEENADPFGFGAAMLAQIDAGAVTPTLIPDVFPEDADF
jgi:antitoxin component of MazEF toxin-antitoxin module